MAEKPKWYSFRRQTAPLFVIPAAVGFGTPSLIIFCLEVFVGGIAPPDSLKDILYRQLAPGHNLFLLAIFGFIPFALLIVILLVSLFFLTLRRAYCLLVGGLLGVLALMVPGHISVWYPLYGGGHASSTAVIAFAFIPFYCIPPMLIGVGVGWAISALPWLRANREEGRNQRTVSRN